MDNITIKDPPPPMRCADEVQFAHDMLVAMLTGKAPMVVGEKDVPYLHAACDCLCYVLLHKHNRTFEKNLVGMKKALEERAYHMRRVKP